MKLFLFVLGLGAALFNGYALQHIWAWSAVPVFPGLPLITLWQAIGLSQLALWVPLLIPSAELKDTPENNANALGRQIFTFVRAAIAMSVSWFAHWMQS